MTREVSRPGGELGSLPQLACVELGRAPEPLDQTEARVLILTRRVGESVMVSTEITVTVIAVKGHQVRIGINAPQEVEVPREDVYERLKQEKAEEGIEALSCELHRHSFTWVSGSLCRSGP